VVVPVTTTSPKKLKGKLGISATNSFLVRTGTAGSLKLLTPIFNSCPCDTISLLIEISKYFPAESSLSVTHTL